MSADKAVVGLRHGGLTAEMVPLLSAGRSVLRIDTGMALHCFARAKAKPSRLICTVKIGGSGECFYDPCRFTYIGERGEGGWIARPEGGWTCNPVPGRKVEVLYRRNRATCDSEVVFDWSLVLAFRLSDQQAAEPASAPVGTNAGNGLHDLSGSSGRVKISADDPIYKAMKPSRECVAAIERQEIAHSQALAVLSRLPTLSRPTAQPEGAEPVAWRYRYYGEDGATRPWTVRQSRIAEMAPSATMMGVEVQPLYAAPAYQGAQGEEIEALSAREQVAEIIRQKVSGPHFTDPALYKAMAKDRLIAADAILAALQHKEGR